jgi:UPF0755 protein
MKKKKVVLSILAILLLAVAFVAYKFFGAAVATPSGEFFYIKTGSSYNDVKNQLVEKKYLNSPYWFDWTSRVLKYNVVKPGRYKIKKGMSLVDLVRMLRSGDQSVVSFVITKIRTREVLASRIGNQFECDSLSMVNFLNNPDSLRQFGLDTNTVMAVALPLTYPITWNTTPGKIFRKFYTAYEDFWNDTRKEKAKSQGITPIQASIVASIVEEETTKAADKPNIASVYLNRVKLGMPLQADPTLKFAIRSFGLKRVLNVHKETVSPYNTYMFKGLPPGPICTPGLETLDAVLDAPKTDYLYFVASSNFDGSHIFTSNYDDHMKYAKMYQKELNRQIKIRDSLQKVNKKDVVP